MRYINKHRRGVYFPDPENSADCIFMREGKPDDVPMFMVEYRLGDNTHNMALFDHFDEAKRKYMHLCLDQIEESKLVVYVRLRAYSVYHGKHITIFESRCFHPAGLYDTEENHVYVKGKAPVAPKLKWCGTPAPTALPE